jgi:hypothetical protein
MSASALSALLFAALVAPAWGADIAVQGPERERRGEVKKDLKVAWDLGLDASIYRLPGAGFAVRTAPFGDADAARLAALSLAKSLGAPALVVELDGEVHKGIFEATPESGAEAPLDQAAIRTLLGAVVDRHGGPEPTNGALADAASVVFTFTRTTPEITARHTYRAEGGDRSLAVEVLSGDGVDSVAEVRGDGATLQVGSAAPTSQDPVRAREVADEFGPAATLGLALRLGPAIAELVDAAEAVDYRLDVVGGTPCHVVDFEDGASTLREVAFAVAGSWVRRVRVASRDGELVQRYDGWSIVDGAPGLFVPGRVEILRGEASLVRVDVAALEVTP